MFKLGICAVPLVSSHRLQTYNFQCTEGVKTYSQKATHCLQLCTGTYVRFQPRSAVFQDAVGDSVEQVLQASMFTHSTLTQGEWVQVQHAGTQHDLKVLALRPAAAVSIIGMH